MCGIAGILSDRPVEPAIVRRMTDPIAHRGPDDEGAWIDPAAGVGLGHRRLSIVDLSPLGHQPMESNDGRYVIVYNGEIYNHAALRAELDASTCGPTSNGIPWRGHSDTETLVEAIAAWGLERTLEKCVGMFAIALWDRRERLLQLVRDRFGEKPLYYGWVGGRFAFASELKAMRSLEGFDNKTDRRALRLFASRSYIPAPLSIYEHIYKLLPGSILTIDRQGVKQPPSGPPEEGVSAGGVSLTRYWSYRDVVRQGLGDPIETEQEALAQLEAALAASIQGQSVADVPVGAFLSGGIDSSIVVGLYHKYSTAKVRTFSIGFEEAAFNEAEYAKQVAAHFGAEHNERYVTVRETQDVIPLLPSMYDEPFADSSQIPTHLVSKFAREQVTVALSGDGGDELFGGYNRYFGTARLWNHMKKLPRPLRSGIGRGMGALPAGTWNGLAAALPAGRRPPHFGTKVQKAFRTMARASNVDTVFSTFLDEWSASPSPVIEGTNVPSQCTFDMDAGEGAPDAVRMMYCDAVSYLPDDILCKVDRAAMSVSLETRVPFLDHRVAAVAARIPVQMKIRGGSGKHILKQLLYRDAPRHLFERPKAGFGIPVGEWIRGPLRGWADELLEGSRLKEDGFFDPAIVQRRWQQHLAGRSDSTHAIWSILMFQAWRREQQA
jgi:asparagine synthase (glutamine-hydrolysing)